ncbi:MAG: hypothetical protein Q4B13_11730 [Lautropia sp.]|nr:hypothetical protein [Lautropia sp.]
MNISFKAREVRRPRHTNGRIIPLLGEPVTLRTRHAANPAAQRTSAQPGAADRRRAVDQRPGSPR